MARVANVVMEGRDGGDGDGGGRACGWEGLVRVFIVCAPL